MGIYTHVIRCSKNPTKTIRLPSFTKAMVTPEFRKKMKEISISRDAGKNLVPFYGISRPHSNESKAKIAKALIGNKNSGGRGKRITALGYTFKSTWEYKAALMLDRLGYNWKYEELTFKINDTSAYTPDFVIYDSNNEPYKIIEVKGYFWPASLIKFNKFKELYPQFKVALWTKEVLKNTGILDISI